MPFGAWPKGFFYALRTAYAREMRKPWNVPRFLAVRINFPLSQPLDFTGFHGYGKFSFFQNTLLTLCAFHPLQSIRGWISLKKQRDRQFSKLFAAFFCFRVILCPA
jgi:hypothetical protein